MDRHSFCCIFWRYSWREFTMGQTSYKKYQYLAVFFFWHFVIITYMKKSRNGFKSFPTHNFTYRQAPCKLWPMHFVLQVFLNSHQYKFANKLPNFVFICFYRITCYLYWIKICLFCNVFVDWFVKKIIKILFWCP